jgi:hypothetical protein
MKKEVDNRWPNYCPFCGTHSRLGGTGNRYGVFRCGNCFADYSVTFHGPYPYQRYEQLTCDEQYVKHGGELPEKPLDPD